MMDDEKKKNFFKGEGRERGGAIFPSTLVFYSNKRRARRA